MDPWPTGFTRFSLMETDSDPFPSRGGDGNIPRTTAGITTIVISCLVPTVIFLLGAATILHGTVIMVFVLSTMCTFFPITPILTVIIAGIFSITLVIALTMATASSRTVAPVTSSIRTSIFGVCTTAGSTTYTAPATIPPIWWFPWWVAPSQGVGAFPCKVALSGTLKTSEGGRGAAPLIGTVPCSVPRPPHVKHVPIIGVASSFVDIVDCCNCLTTSRITRSTTVVSESASDEVTVGSSLNATCRRAKEL